MIDNMEDEAAKQPANGKNLVECDIKVIGDKQTVCELV